MVKRSQTCLKQTDIVRRALWLLIMVVLLGYLTMWVIMPTRLYRQTWLPNIRETVNSDYFGSQGANILTFFFPVLFIAALGSVYLHLRDKSTHNNNNFKTNGSLASWKKPMLVKGPLGIVSGVELAILMMFIALLIWSFATYMHNFFATITPQSAAQSGEKVWEAKLDKSALTLGIIGNMGLTLLFFPVARGSSVLPLFGLTSEGSIKYHIWLGHFVMVFFTAHGLSYIVYWAVTHQISEILKWRKADFSNVAGELSLMAGLGLWAATFPRIRRKMFELFFYTHHLYVLFMLFFLLHVPISFACLTLPGFYLFLVDRYLRFLQSRTKVRLVSARILPCETLELNFSKAPGLSYNPTSILFVNVPAISKLQWHPFTITSSSNLEPERLSVMIKGDGGWSKKLFHMLSSPSLVDRLEASVEGPYGPVSTNFLRHETLVMVSGGSGITPFISITREMAYVSAIKKCKTPQVILICSFKNSSELNMLDLLLPVSGTPFPLSDLQLKVEAYVTREKEPPADNAKLIQTIWFKHYQTDQPICAILGPNSWLWLGAVIASSFIIFLVIIGLITRFYIYPIDHNTNDIFSYSLRSFLNILVICVCIAITASAAVLWNKKQNAREAVQVQNIEGPTPVGSPASSWFINGDRELESLPQKSLAEATNVHYGERPDLKRMLFECKGSSVGVLVCGPTKMRHEVARICSSGLADNLHFESISFSW